MSNAEYQVCKSFVRYSVPLRTVVEPQLCTTTDGPYKAPTATTKLEANILLSASNRADLRPLHTATTELERVCVCVRCVAAASCVWLSYYSINRRYHPKRLANTNASPCLPAVLKSRAVPYTGERLQQCVLGYSASHILERSHKAVR